MPYLQVLGARELGRLHQLCCNCLVIFVARLPQGRAALLYVCVCANASQHACMWGGGVQEDIKGGKGGGGEGDRRECCSAQVSPMSIDMNIYFCFDIYVSVYIYV